MKYVALLIFSLVGLSVAAQSQVAVTKKNQGKTVKLFNDAHEEHVSFQARESVSSDKTIVRHGVLIKRPKAQATVLICHGFMCDKYDVSFLHILFTDFNSMTFDFRAHGEDKEGQCSTLGRNEAYDVIAAAEFIKNHPELKDTPLIVYGFSMGAVAAIIAQANCPHLFDAMILDSPFDSTDKLLDRGIEKLKINFFGYQVRMPGSSFLKSYAYTPYVQSILKTLFRTFAHLGTTEIEMDIGPVYPEAAITYIDIPCFFIACINDDKAPEEAVLSVYNGAKGYKRCWIDPDGRRHYDTIFRKMNRYFYKVDKFVRNFLDGSYKDRPREKIKRDLPYCVISAAKKTAPVVSS